MNNVILKPVVSEKTVGLQKDNVFTFLVALKTTKKMIKDEAEKMFGVKVVAVSTINYKPTRGRTMKKTKFTKSGYKKAMLKLSKDSKMLLFEEGKKEK